MGSRKTDTAESAIAAATQVRSIAAASSGRAGQANDHGIGESTRGEEGERRPLAAQLIFGIVQVGQVLDLEDGDETGETSPEAKTEDRLLVEQCVEYACRAVPAGKAPGEPVHPTLDADILAKDDHSRLRGENVAQCGVDRFG